MFGAGGIGPFQLLIILVIVLLLFGTKKLRNLGGDLGGAIKGFRSSMKDVSSTEESAESTEESAESAEPPADPESLAESVEKADSNDQTTKA